MNVSSELKRAQLDNQSSDPTNPQDGLTYWSTSVGKMKIYNKLSSAWNIISNAVDYIANSGGDSTADGYAAYADAAGVTPVDGTGGTSTTTITRTTLTPLRGGASLLITKDAANRQGEGVSYDFTIANADKGQQLSVAFDYESAGGFTTGGSSDVQMFMYDVTNAGLVALSTVTIDNATGRFSATFTAAVNSTSYRLVFHIATVNAAAWTLKFDRVTVSPNLIISATPSAIPTGIVMDYAGAAAPSGFLFCDGANVSRSLFATLFATIGTSYGAGDGATTFGVPDLRGRIGVGRDSMGDNIPATATLHSHFQDDTIGANFALGSTTATTAGTTGPSVVSFNGSLKTLCPNTAGDGFSYPAATNDPGDIGTIRMVWTPAYAGTPGGNDRRIFEIGTTSPINLIHRTTGNIEFNITNTGGAQNFVVVAFSPTANQDYEIEVGWDSNAGAIAYVFIDGILQTGAGLVLAAGTRTVDGDIKLGQIGIAGGSDSYYDDITVFNTVQHTVNYTPGTTFFGNPAAGRMTTSVSGVDGATLGAVGGTQTHTLSEVEMPPHVHPISSDGAHVHELDNGVQKMDLNTSLHAADGARSGLSLDTTTFDTTSVGIHNHGGATGSTGGGAIHQNTQPTQIVNKIIKT